MKLKTLIIIITLFFCTVSLSQNNKTIFVQAECQMLNDGSFSVGLGYQPIGRIDSLENKHSNFSFIGWGLNYTKSIMASDWGLSLQALVCPADYRNPIGAGLEGNYRLISNNPHFGIKPMIGLSFPIISIMYGYNIDFCKTSKKKSQHELTLGIRVPLF